MPAEGEREREREREREGERGGAGRRCQLEPPQQPAFTRTGQRRHAPQRFEITWLELSFVHRRRSRSDPAAAAPRGERCPFHSTSPSKAQLPPVRRPATHVPRHQHRRPLVRRAPAPRRVTLVRRGRRQHSGRGAVQRVSAKAGRHGAAPQGPQGGWLWCLVGLVLWCGGGRMVVWVVWVVRVVWVVWLVSVVRVVWCGWLWVWLRSAAPQGPRGARLRRRPPTSARSRRAA